METKQLESANKAKFSLRRNAAIVKNDFQTISVRSLVVTLYRYKWLSLLVFVLIAAATFFYTASLRDKYSSRMKILVRDTRSDARVTAQDTKGEYFSQGTSENDINTEIELLKSRDLLQELVQRANLIEPKKADAPSNSKTVALQIDEAIDKVEGRLDVSPIKKSNIIEVSYTADSPERAAAVLQELSALYLDKHLRMRSSSEGYDLFKEQAGQFAVRLKADENRLAAFENANNLVAIEEQKQTSLRSLADAETSFHEADAALGENEKRAAALKKQLTEVSPRILTQTRTAPNQGAIERYNEMIVEMRNKRTQLLTKYRANDRLVKEVDEQIKTTLEALEAASRRNSTEQSTDLNPLRQKLETDLAIAATNADALRVRRAVHSNQVAQYRNTLNNLENATRQHEALKRTVKQSEENYLLYARKSEEARITNVMDKEKISNVEIAEAATISHSPSSPNRPMTMMLGLFLAAFAGICIAFAAEFMRDTVATPDELESITDYQVLASLPHYRNSFYKSIGDGQ